MRTASLPVPSIIASLTIALLVPAMAQPPAHAPAHGFRAKHVGHTGYEWELDYGVLSGRCDRQKIATVVGGLTGAFIANRVADENRTVATLIGAAAGALIGNKIGRELDEADQGCFGHVLELGKARQIVTWTNESTGVSYQMAPGADRNVNGAACREFSLLATMGSERSTKNGLACQSARGVWQVVE